MSAIETLIERPRYKKSDFFKVEHLTKEMLLSIKQKLKNNHILIIPQLKIKSEDLLLFVQKINAEICLQDPEQKPMVKIEDKKGDLKSTSHLAWHSDHAFRVNPPPFVLLYASQTPERGGDIRWCNHIQAYKKLSEKQKLYLQPIKAKHCLHHFYKNYDFPAHFKSEKQKNTLLKRAHCKRPVVGYDFFSQESFLDLSEAYTSELLNDEKSVCEDHELQKLLSHCYSSSHIFNHQWQAGDLLLANNRVLSHSRGASPVGGGRQIYKIHFRFKEGEESV